MVVTVTGDILAHLSGVSVPLLDSDNGFVERITPREVQVLTSFQQINGHVYKGRLTHVRLRPGVSARLAMQRLSPLQVAASGHVTKRRQDRGAKRWVPHFERSEGGVVGTSKRLAFPLGYDNRRLAVGRVGD